MNTSLEKKFECKMIDVGDDRLYFKYIFGEIPAVIFESGGGMNSSEWDQIMNILSQKVSNALISYDRSGFGKSELPESSYNIETEVKNLHNGLKILGFTDELVLVGHSYGGYLIHKYTNMYSSSVKGLIFLDSNSVEFCKLVNYKDSIKQQIDTMPQKTKEDKGNMRVLLGFADTIEQIKLLKYSNQPCYVITSGQRWLPTDEMNDHWEKSQKSLAVSLNTELLVSNGGHIIPDDDPDIVISAITKLLDVIG